MTTVKQTAARFIARSGGQLLAVALVVAYHWRNDLDGLLAACQTLAELFTQGVMK